MPVPSFDTRVTNEGYLQQTDTATDNQSQDGGSGVQAANAGA